MRRWFRRSGHATIVAYLALFLAVGGGAFAIAKGTKINGSKLKKRSVAAAKLKKHTLTGTEINLSKLGTVPKAKASETATTASTAGSATVAGSVATTSPNATVRATSSATGASFEAAAAAATAVTLYEDSHFRVYGKCFTDSSGPELLGVIYIATKQNGAVFDGEEDELSGEPPDGYLDTGTPEESREVQVEDTGPNGASVFESSEFGAIASDGYTITGNYQIAVKSEALATGNGAYGPGEVCLFAGYVVHS
jgi:hypothetical protein